MPIRKSNSREDTVCTVMRRSAAQKRKAVVVRPVYFFDQTDINTFHWQTEVKSFLHAAKVLPDAKGRLPDTVSGRKLSRFEKRGGKSCGPQFQADGTLQLDWTNSLHHSEWNKRAIQLLTDRFIATMSSGSLGLALGHKGCSAEIVRQLDWVMVRFEAAQISKSRDKGGRKRRHHRRA